MIRCKTPPQRKKNINRGQIGLSHMMSSIRYHMGSMSNMRRDKNLPGMSLYRSLDATMHVLPK
jgi:hypothetical protein